MTVASEVKRVQNNGNGATTAFSVPFYFLDEDHLIVILTDSSGNDTTQTKTTHYTVTGAGDQSGGTVTMVTAPASGEKLTILRNIPLTQDTDYVENDSFPAETHEEAIDKLTMITQQLDELATRSLKAPTTTSITDGEIADTSVVADYYLKINASADGFTTISPSNASTELTLGTSLTPTDGNFLVGDGTDWVEESGNTARTSLGLGTGSSPTFTGLSLTGTLDVAADIIHTGDTNNKITFTTDTQTYQTGGSTRMDITDSGVQLGGSGARVTTILDEDTLSSDSATALATQQSIKAYVDGQSTGMNNVVEDTTPQLGGDLDVNTNSIVSTSNGNITLNPNGTGNVVLGNYTLDGDQTVGAGQDNYVLTYDNSSGLVSLEAASGGGSEATQAEMEAGTSTTAFVSPAKAQFHPSAAKVWLQVGITGNIQASYNVTSVTDTGVGVATPVYTTDFSSTTYAAITGVLAPDAGAGTSFVSAIAVDGCTIQNENSANGAALDPTFFMLVCYGDQ